ncbi:hypothetical protein CEXT_321101 [Caerostris extrusa]|uniref:Uncharacterized protein n=1 Tax=Caerostris extrusa TaxID=172846 RepID=A0AAV4NQW6_CAEEX|nr:hypothetical protein CEXT_321101 [Caerostris extrusa]
MTCPDLVLEYTERPELCTDERVEPMVLLDILTAQRPFGAYRTAGCRVPEVQPEVNRSGALAASLPQAGDSACRGRQLLTRSRKTAPILRESI